MDINSYLKAYELLTKEHQEQYDNFTRLMLTLSVAFITLVIGLRTTPEIDYSVELKFALVLHSLSILTGILVQYCLVIQPISDLKRAFKLINDDKNVRTTVFDRPPSKTQRYSFNVQVLTFLAAFCILVFDAVV